MNVSSCDKWDTCQNAEWNADEANDEVNDEVNDEWEKSNGNKILVFIIMADTVE